ncbi:hypothetical protein FRC19_003579 [Serendipita sp. 401]|nr:hypothetical protein FRC19_003579 [Serendipita sp. 401]
MEQRSIFRLHYPLSYHSLSAGATEYYDTDASYPADGPDIYSENTPELITPSLLNQSVFSDSVVPGTDNPREVVITDTTSQTPAIQQAMDLWHPGSSNTPVLDTLSHARDEALAWFGRCSQADDDGPYEVQICDTVERKQNLSPSVNEDTSFEAWSGDWNTTRAAFKGVIRARRNRSQGTGHHFGPAVSRPSRSVKVVVDQQDPSVMQGQLSYASSGKQSSLSNVSNIGPKLAAPLPVVAHPIGVADMSLEGANQMELWPQPSHFSYGISYTDQQYRSNGYQPYPRNGTPTRYLESRNRMSRSPPVGEELDPHTKTIVDDYLLRYLNYLCINYEAVDRSGRRIHQQYTVRRIERDEELYGWRPLKFRIEAFVNAFIDILIKEGMSYDMTTHVPHYLSRSNIFSRFNESGNRMKSQGQNIWRVRARYRNTGDFADYHSTAVLDQSAQGYSIFPIMATPPYVHYDPGRMLSIGPLLWEFLPYERSIVGQPPMAVAGKPWLWNLRLHDHWASRKAVHWKLIAAPELPLTAHAPDMGTGGHFGSPPGLPSVSWLTVRNSQLIGTPPRSGRYPIDIEAVCQDDGRAEPVVVRGSFTINVSGDTMWPKNRRSPSTTGESTGSE